MAYRIVYGREQEAAAGGLRRTLLTAVMAICLLLAVWNFWPEGREVLKILLIPGDPDVTMEAAQVFAQELGTGFSLGDAAGNFCETVLNHGSSG